MRGVSKEFDAVTAEWSSRGERELKEWLRNSGYLVTHHPHGTHGVDLRAQNKHEAFYVEVERTGTDRWEKGMWPPKADKYSTLNVLERRGRYDDEVLLFVLRMDLKAGLVVWPSSLLEERLEENPNKLVENGEFAFKVPLIEILPIDLSKPLEKPIAVLNVERVMEAYAHAVKWNLTLAAKRNILHNDRVPYGMHREDWERLHLEADKAHEPKALRKCDHDDEANHVVTGVDMKGRTRITCKICTGVIKYLEPPA